MIRQLKELEKISVNHISDMGLLFRICTYKLTTQQPNDKQPNWSFHHKYPREKEWKQVLSKMPQTRTVLTKI